MVGEKLTVGGRGISISTLFTFKNTLVFFALFAGN
jgi:hypothetical protein